MSTSAPRRDGAGVDLGRRRTALDRLATPTAHPEPLEGRPDSERDGQPASAATSPWGVTAVPTWLNPSVHDEHQADDQITDRARMSVGDRFGEHDPDEDEDDQPRRRFLVAPPAAIALILVGVIACVVAGISLLRQDSQTATPVAFGAQAGPTATAESGISTAAPPSESAELVVSVVGLVHRPGLVRLAGSARVADALARAGGARKGADLLSLNLAQRLHDGDQILVGYVGDGGRMALRSAVVGASGSSGSPTSGGIGTDPTSAAPGGGTAGKVDLNTATEEQLDALPGVGPVTAKAILAWRDAHGRFTSVEQLGEVDGIGPARLARLRDQVTV